MKKSLLTISAVIITAVVFLSSCTSSYNLKLNVGTGDRISVTMDTTDNCKMSYENDTFNISDNSNNVMEGTFITLDAYNETYLPSANTYGVLDSGQIDGMLYTVYSEDGTTYSFIGAIENSNTAVLFRSISTQEKATELFKKLSFAKIEKEDIF